MIECTACIRIYNSTRRLTLTQLLNEAVMCGATTALTRSEVQRHRDALTGHQ